MACSRRALWLLAICGGLAHAANTPPPISATQAWVRWLPGNLPAGGYLTLRNDGDRPATLVSVSSPDFALVSLHRSTLSNAVSTMQPVPQIVLPPHQSLSFAAGGYHIMLEQATRPLKPGDHVSITLHLSDGSSLDVSLELRRPDAG